MRRQSRLLFTSVALLIFVIASSKGFSQAPSGTHRTSTSLVSSGIQGSYAFNATITAYGASLPSGSVVFTDTTTGTTLGSVAVGTANKNGGFGSLLTLNSLYNPDGAVAADVNGDGIPDLIIALANPYASAPPGAPANNNPGCTFCPGTQNIQVYLGNGDGTFQSPSYYPAGFDPNHIVIADVNGDGYPDMIVTDYDEVFGGTITSGGAYPINEGYYEMGVYLNKGKSAPGTFAPVVYYKTGTNPWNAVVGDFNGDGFSDIIVDNSTDGTLQLFPGDGSGTFNTPSKIVATGVSFESNHSFATADVNGDGILDLIGVNYTTGYVQVLLGNGSGKKGNGTFGSPMNFGASSGALSNSNPVGVAVGDVNGDGKPDIVTSNRGSGNVGVLLGNGDGTFQQVTVYPIGDGGGSFAGGVAIADMNSDGFPDIIVADNGASSDIGVLYGNGNGTFQSRVGVGVGAGSGTPLIADFNRDGRLDIGTENFNPNTTTTVLGYATETVSLTGVTLPGSTTDNVVATYSGDSTYATSTSNVLNLKSGGLLEPQLSTPATAAAGTSFTFTVAENNRGGTPATNYTGTLTFSSSDPLAKLPAPSSLVNGVGTFTVTLYTDGPQTIGVSDNVNGLNATSPNITVSGGGATLALASGSSNSATLNYGATATYTFTVTPTVGIFNAPVNFSLSGLPSNSYVYTFNPATIAAGASGQQTVTLQVKVPVLAQVKRSNKGAEPLLALVCLLPFAAFIRKRRLARIAPIFTCFLFATVLFAMTALSGCNNTNTPYQPPSTYSLAVTATSGSTSSTSNVTLIVKPNSQ